MINKKQCYEPGCKGEGVVNTHHDLWLCEKHWQAEMRNDDELKSYNEINAASDALFEWLEAQDLSEDDSPKVLVITLARLLATDVSDHRTLERSIGYWCKWLRDWTRSYFEEKRQKKPSAKKAVRR